MSSPDYTNYLAGGMQVTKLSLAWQKQIEFNLGDDLCLTKIRFSDLIKEQNNSIDSDDYAAHFDADLALMSGSFAELINSLIEQFGGIDESIE